MNEQLQQKLITHGAIVFLLGLAAGFPFAFFVSGEIALWPIPGAIEIQLPGTERGWRMAHLEGILNGLTCLAVAGIGHRLRLNARAQAWVAYGLIITAYGNIIASALGPVFTTAEFTPRGLEFGDGFINTAMYLLFVAAIVAGVAAIVLVGRGAATAQE